MEQNFLIMHVHIHVPLHMAILYRSYVM